MVDRPNVLLITADHMRRDALGCNGNEFVRTPHLDALARRGVTFACSYTPNPICVPARASITTGNYSHVCTGTKSNGGRIRDDQVKIAAHFAQAGYRSIAVGKLHYVPYAPPGEPRLLHGFQHAELCEEGRIIARFDPTGRMRGLEDYHDWLLQTGWGGYERAHAIGNNDVHAAASPLPEEFHPDSWVATRAIANLDTHLRSNPDQPFFMWASFTKPHPPYDPPQPWDRMYDPREIPPPVGTCELLADRDPMYRTWPIAYGWDRMSPEAIQNSRAHYFGLVSFQDHNIGRIIAFLRDTGALDDTIIVYTADHGDLLGDFRCFFKCNMFEGSVGVPLIFAGPGVAPQGSVSALAGLQDILPTLADMTGAPLPRQVMGKSLAAVLAGEQSRVREHYVAQSLDSPNQRYMVRSERWKYVYHELGGVEELYDEVADPAELRNLAAHKPEVVAELRGMLIDWARENGDDALLDDSGDLVTSPEEGALCEGFEANRMGWRWY
ncbi:MAG: sulfatase [Armatimonadota bacterium]